MSFFFDGFPGFGGPGGPGGMPGQEDEEDQANTDNERYYKLLEVSKDASDKEITRGYRKLARKLHPDRHPGEAEKYKAKFQEIEEAYSILKDPQKREIYDKYGEDAAKRGGPMGGGGGFGDIFDHIFGGGGRRRGPQGPRRAPEIIEKMDITLEDIYKGPSKKAKFTRATKCDKCKGKGGKKEVECPHCGGRGVVIVVQRMGMMTMQTQRPCRECSGEGRYIPDKYKCKVCKGKKMKQEEKTVDVQIPTGARQHDKITIKGIGHQVEDRQDGDVTFVLREVEHKIFERMGADLGMKYSLTLKQAMCGYEIYIPHVSGRLLQINSKRGHVTQPGSLKRVMSWGLPQKGSGYIKGHLYIQFDVKLPELIKEPVCQSLEKILPEQKLPENDVDEALKTHKQMENGKPKWDSKMEIDSNKRNGANDEPEGEIDDEEEHPEPPEHVEAEVVIGKPKVTPASSGRSAYDEDDDENVQSCRTM